MITSGTQTYSKQACRYVEGVYPTFLEGGSGPLVYDLDGNSYVDYIGALGVNILGYANPYVNEQVKARIDRGILFPMPSIHETILAEKIVDMFPSMESMRFLKSGSEAVSAGVKIARAYTERDIVLTNGYHGWHDWSTPVTIRNGGTPQSLSETIFSFEYNNLSQVKSLLEKHKNQVACIIIDPFVFDEPVDDFLSKLILLAHKHGTLVLFDEVVTGLRWKAFAVQNYYGLKPDLTALGKSLGNGFPISVIGGRRPIMSVLDKSCFVSTTFGGELASIIGAIATLKIAKDENLPDRLYESGETLSDNINDLANYYGLNMSCKGNPARMKMDFPSNEHKALFWQECCKRGVLFGSAQHTTLAHTEPILDTTIQTLDEVMSHIRLFWENPKSGLEGKPPQAVETISSLRS